MRNSLFVIFCLMLVAGGLSFYSAAERHFKNDPLYQAQIRQLEHKIVEKDLEKDQLVFQFKDFQQSIAQVLPQNSQLVADMKAKNLASVLRQPASVQKVDLSGVMFARGKRFFAEENYDKAIAEFERLQEQYPLSQHTVEAKFLSAEGYFLKRDYRSSLNVIDDMVELYPDNELTGYILLRMGQISELNGQTDEALEVYNAVQRSFQTEKLKQQAQRMAASVEIK